MKELDLLEEVKQLRAERDAAWSLDGNSPGYNKQKAQTYGAIAASLKVERDLYRSTLEKVLESSSDMMVRQMVRDVLKTYK